MRCARCNRQMDKPAAMVGGYPIGPKCWALMGGKAPRKPAADVVRDECTLDLFVDDKYNNARQ